MKLRILCVVLAVLFACSMFLSTAPADRIYEYIGTSAHLIKTEYKNILSFFSKSPYSTNERGTAASSPTSKPAVPELSAKLHTELLPSPFNSADKASTAASVGGTDLCGMGADILNPAEKYGYISVPVFPNRSLSDVSRILSAHGIPYTTVMRTNTAPAGEVFAVRYAGMSAPNGYYINPNISLTLYVSAAKEAQTASEGDNLVYLTFDDGPSPAHTEAILDILDTYGIKGTFFTLGTAVEKHPELAVSVIERGHTLGCHTMTHVYDEIYSSVQALEKEVEDWEAAVENAGIDLSAAGRYFRFPGGSVGPRLTNDKLNDMKAMLAERGYKVYDWNVATNDAVLYLAPEDTTSYNYIKQSFVDSLDLCLKINENKPDEPIIVLMHEGGDETAQLLTWLIEHLEERSLSFGELADLGKSWTFSE